MSHTIVISVLGTPRPQPRPRFNASGKGRPISTDADKRAKFWAGCIRQAGVMARESLGGMVGVKAILGCGPIQFEAEYRIPTPQEEKWGHLHWELTPDLDNLTKLALDNLFIDPKSPGVSLTNLGDNAVATFGPMYRKIWSRPQKAGATFRLTRLDSSRLESPLTGSKPTWL